MIKWMLLLMPLNVHKENHNINANEPKFMKLYLGSMKGPVLHKFQR